MATQNISASIKRLQLVFTLLLGLLLLAENGLALEAGELTLRSKLGAPLLAEIPISNHQGLSTQELIIEQAPIAIYQKMGVDTDALNRELKFTMGSNGVVTVTSRNPIKEPYVSFILKFNWPEGELYREYNILMDPS